MKRWKRQVFVIVMILSLMTTMAACGNKDAGGESKGGEKTIVYGQGGAWNRLMPYDLIGMFSIMPNEKFLTGCADLIMKTSSITEPQNLLTFQRIRLFLPFI